MGEIAEDIIEGTCCSWCGLYFQSPDNPDELYSHGYPVLCKDCYKNSSWKEKDECGLTQKPLANTI